MTDIKTVHTTEQLLDMWDQATKRNDPHPQLAFARAIEAAVLAASAPAQEPVWRCFHCDEVFDNAADARLHFGKDQTRIPACHIDIAEYRTMESRMIAYNQEDAEIHRMMRQQSSAHAVALRREEEIGYARGLRDAGYMGVATVDAQDAVEICEMRLCEVPRVMLRPNIHYIFTVDENCEACKSAEFHATPIDWQAIQSPQDQVKP